MREMKHTRLFHAAIRKKLRANELRGLYVNAVWIEETTRLKEEVKEFFKARFSSQKLSGKKLISDKIRRLQANVTQNLERAFSE